MSLDQFGEELLFDKIPVELDKEPVGKFEAPQDLGNSNLMQIFCLDTELISPDLDPGNNEDLWICDQVFIHS
jgi:hypothetical protein